MTLFELCAGSPAAAVEGARAGVDRIELCTALEVGGTTPAPADLEHVLARVAVPVFALIRPRGGEFVYTPEELDAMEGQVTEARRCGAHGLVLGALDEAGGLDRAALATLLEAAGDLPVTFHRAFDEVADPGAALEELVSLGVRRILTSGGARTAWQGRAHLRALVERAAGRIAVAAGGGVRADHAAALVAETGVGELHASVPLPVETA